MLKLVRVLAMLALVLGLAGCQSTVPDSAEPGRSGQPVANASAPVAMVTLPEPFTIAAASPLTPVALPAPPAPANPLWPSNWLTGWIPLESWTDFNHLGKPVKLTSGASPTYQVHTTNGSLTVAVNVPMVRAQGINVWLAYPPRLIKGQPHVYSLDAQKTLQPLVRPEVRYPTTNWTVVIDPGHGGKDSGTLPAANGQPEKFFTLDLALRLRQLLATNGWKVVLTRTQDVNLTLAERVEMADRMQADLFVSLHFNSGLPNRERAGIETYCLTPQGLPSNLLREPLDDVRLSFPNNAHDHENLVWAVRLHQALIQASGAPDRGVQRARFMSVLRGQRRPAVLIEAGYLSNLTEARRVANPEYRQNLAVAMARQFDRFLKPESLDIVKRGREGEAISRHP